MLDSRITYRETHRNLPPVPQGPNFFLNLKPSDLYLHLNNIFTPLKVNEGRTSFYNWKSPKESTGDFVAEHTRLKQSILVLFCATGARPLMAASLN